LNLLDLNKKINSELIGNKTTKINSISSIQKVSANSIVFLLKYDSINEELMPTNTSFLLDSKTYKCFKNPANYNFLIVEDPKIAFAMLTKLFKKDISSPEHQIIKPNAYKILVGKGVSFGDNFKYGFNCLVEDNVKIGNDVTFGNNVVIYADTIIGNNVSIESGSVIGSEGFGNVINKDKKWNHIFHLGNVIIENDVHIGSNCCIDRATIDSTIVHSGVMIDNLVHIAHNVIIGENTAIAAKVGIAGSCNIGKRNMIGGMVGIVDHINTTDDVIISATSSVYTDIKEPGVYTGIMPTFKHAAWKRIAFWITKLDKIAKVFKTKEK